MEDNDCDSHESWKPVDETEKKVEEKMEEEKIDYETEEEMQEVTEEMLEVEPVPKTSCTVTKKMAKMQNEECATTSSADRRQIDCSLASCKAKVVHLASSYEKRAPLDQGNSCKGPTQI